MLEAYLDIRRAVPCHFYLLDSEEEKEYPNVSRSSRKTRYSVSRTFWYIFDSRKPRRARFYSFHTAKKLQREQNFVSNLKRTLRLSYLKLSSSKYFSVQISATLARQKSLWEKLKTLTNKRSLINR